MLRCCQGVVNSLGGKAAVAAAALNITELNIRAEWRTASPRLTH